MKRMNFPHRREQRKLEAQERQAKFDALSEYEKARRRGWTTVDIETVVDEFVAAPLRKHK